MIVKVKTKLGQNSINIAYIIVIIDKFVALYFFKKNMDILHQIKG